MLPQVLLNLYIYWNSLWYVLLVYFVDIDLGKQTKLAITMRWVFTIDNRELLLCHVDGVLLVNSDRIHY